MKIYDWKIYEFYEDFWNDLSLFGKCTMFPLVVLYLPMIAFAILCEKED